MSRIVVVGGGLAAHRFVERLRHRGHRGEVLVIGAEPDPPYNRTLLASVLAGTLAPAAVALPALPAGTGTSWATTAVRLDRRARVVWTDDGRAHRYDRLVLATGARPRIPAIPGLRQGARLAGGVRAVRTIADCRPLPDGPVAVLGAGVLGVEVGLALRRAGHPVTLVHPHPYPMNRQLDAGAGELLLRHLRERGIDVRARRTAVRYDPGRLRLDDGAVLAVRTVLLCTGVRPDVALARAAGLVVADGVVVDERLCGSDPRIHAIGDCAQPTGSAAVGGIGAAWAQAEALADLLTGGRARHRADRPVLRLRDPELDVVALGRPTAPARPGAETVRLTDPAGRRHAALTLRHGRITAAVLYGLPSAVAAVSQLYDRDLPVPADRLALLLGTVPGTGAVELPDDAVVCVCNTVTKAELVGAWHRGCRDVPALAAATRATTGCGNCDPEVRRICAGLTAAGPARRTLPAYAGADRC